MLEDVAAPEENAAPKDAAALDDASAPEVGAAPEAVAALEDRDVERVGNDAKDAGNGDDVDEDDSSKESRCWYSSICLAASFSHFSLGLLSTISSVSSGTM